MAQKMIARPDHDFEVIRSSGEELMNKTIFTSDTLIIKCTSGEALFSINAQSHWLRTDISFLLLDSSLFQLLERSDDFSMTSYRFSLQFFSAIYPMLNEKVLDVVQYGVPDLYTPEELKSADFALSHLSELYSNKEHEYRNKLAVNLVICYILEIYEITRKHAQSELSTTSSYNTYILERLFELFQKYHYHNRSSEFYAKELNISTRYLHKIITSALQLTPKELIDYYVVNNIKKILLTTILSNQQIADKMSFSDQSAFSQYFKRNVGMSPSEFRQRYK